MPTPTSCLSAGMITSRSVGRGGGCRLPAPSEESSPARSDAADGMAQAADRRALRRNTQLATFARARSGGEHAVDVPLLPPPAADNAAADRWQSGQPGCPRHGGSLLAGQGRPQCPPRRPAILRMAPCGLPGDAARGAGRERTDDAGAGLQSRSRVHHGEHRSMARLAQATAGRQGRAHAVLPRSPRAASPRCVVTSLPLALPCVPWG